MLVEVVDVLNGAVSGTMQCPLHLVRYQGVVYQIPINLIVTTRKHSVYLVDDQYLNYENVYTFSRDHEE